MVERGRIEYRPAVITFLDILGFRDRVERSRDATEIAGIMRQLRSFADVGRNGQTAEPDEAETTHAIAFSDSVMRIRFIDAPHPTGALFHEILKLVHLQGTMASRDVFLRGGVTVGSVHLDGDMAFGPGFNRAYGLESEFAQYPRIVIGQEAFDAIRGDRRLVCTGHTTEEDIAYIRRLVTRGDDGLWFVDYLAALRGELDHPEFFPRLVAEHPARILEGAASAGRGSRVFQKYMWLAHYLNGVVERCRLPHELKLTRDEITALDALADKPHWMSDEEYLGLE